MRDALLCPVADVSGELIVVVQWMAQDGWSFYCTYLQVKHAGLLRVLELGVLGSLLEETVHLRVHVSNLFFVRVALIWSCGGGEVFCLVAGVIVVVVVPGGAHRPKA